MTFYNGFGTLPYREGTDVDLVVESFSDQTLVRILAHGEFPHGSGTNTAVEVRAVKRELDRRTQRARSKAAGKRERSERRGSKAAGK